MTEAELHALFDYWRDALGLESWRLALVKGGCDDDAYMQVERSNTYERATIRWQPWLLGEGDVPAPLDFGVPIEDADVEISLVHELLHLQTRDMARVVRGDLDGFLHRDVYSQVENAFNRAEEQAVDRMAVALVRHRRRWDERGRHDSYACWVTPANGISGL